MATYGELNFLDLDSRYSCGALFNLDRAPDVDVDFEFDEGKITIAQGQQTVSVEFEGSVNAEDTFKKGYRVVQKGLDLLSILGRLDVLTTRAQDEHFVWWKENGQEIIRLVSTSRLNFSVNINAQVIKKDGSVKPDRELAYVHHPSLRYYRMAQATDDLFDAYRNMYLAFESMISSRFAKQKSESESEWIERALNDPALQKLAVRLAPIGSTEPMKDITKSIYKDVRCPLFHAKQGNVHYLPNEDEENRKQTSQSLDILTKLVTTIAKQFFGTRRGGGGVYLKWVYDNVKQLLDGCRIVATNYRGTIGESDSDLSHERFANGIFFDSTLGTDGSDGLAPTLLGRCNTNELSHLGSITRVEVVDSSKAYVCEVLDHPLRLDGFDRFEFLMRIRVSNKNQPKSVFHR